jgi:hypothetical protein
MLGTVLAHVLRFDELEERLRVVEQRIKAQQRWRMSS